MMNKITIFLLAFAFITVISACSKDSEEIFEEQLEEIDQYISDEGLTAIEVAEAPGVYYTIESAGNGVDYPTQSSTVTVHYTGRLLDGTKFDSSSGGQPSTFSLSSVITGWRVGIPKFRKGDIGKLIIPSKYGYGSNATGSIPANSILVFDIELIDFD